MAKKNNKLVYSTQGGDQRKETDDSSAPAFSLPAEQQQLKITRERKGRRGKDVTVITGFVLTDSDLKKLAKKLKTYCGAGGTTKNDDSGQTIEIQGDHRTKIAELLVSFGYNVKLAGG